MTKVYKTLKEEFTSEQLEAWLGSDSLEEEALTTLLELLNGDYKIENFRKEVREYEE